MTTTKQAFNIIAKVERKIWMTKGTTLTASNESEAREKAINILGLTNEHEIKILPVTVHSHDAKLTTDKYPYGSLKCTAFYSVEYNAKKGFRTIFQTINPKNGRINNPKKGNYYEVILPLTDNQTGHFSGCGYLNFNGTDSINTGLYFMADFYDLFTTDQIKNIALTIIAMQKVNAKAYVIYTGADWEQLKPLITDSMHTLTEIAQTGENLFLNAILNAEKIDALKIPDYNPFKVSSTTI